MHTQTLDPREKKISVYEILIPFFGILFLESTGTTEYLGDGPGPPGTMILGRKF